MISFHQLKTLLFNPRASLLHFIDFLLILLRFIFEVPFYFNLRVSFTSILLNHKFATAPLRSFIFYYNCLLLFTASSPSRIHLFLLRLLLLNLFIFPSFYNSSSPYNLLSFFILFILVSHRNYCFFLSSQRLFNPSSFSFLRLFLEICFPLLSFAPIRYHIWKYILQLHAPESSVFDFTVACLPVSTSTTNRSKGGCLVQRIVPLLMLCTK